MFNHFKNLKGGHLEIHILATSYIKLLQVIILLISFDNCWISITTKLHALPIKSMQPSNIWNFSIIADPRCQFDANKISIIWFKLRIFFIFHCHQLVTIYPIKSQLIPCLYFILCFFEFAWYIKSKFFSKIASYN